MKKIFVLFLLVTSAAISSYGWNSIGHAATAKIAENHISPLTKESLEKYLGDETIVSISKDADKHYSDWLRDLGFEISNPQILRRQHSEKLASCPSNIEPWCHSFTVDSLFNVYRVNREGDVVIRNAIMDLDQIAGELKNGIKSMSPEEARIKISLLVHILGDCHCPFHILYEPKDPTGGAYSYYIGDDFVCPHTLWDNLIWNYLNPEWTYEDYAREADTATPSEISEITRGYLYDWGRESARDAFEAHDHAPYEHVDSSYPQSLRPLLYKQLRNGGYRLAALLDYIFSDSENNPKADPKAEVVFANFIMENPSGLYGYVDALKDNLSVFEKNLETQTLIPEEFKTVLKAQISGK